MRAPIIEPDPGHHEPTAPSKQTPDHEHQNLATIQSSNSLVAARSATASRQTNSVSRNTFGTRSSSATNCIWLSTFRYRRSSGGRAPGPALKKERNPSTDPILTLFAAQWSNHASIAGSQSVSLGACGTNAFSWWKESSLYLAFTHRGVCATTCALMRTVPAAQPTHTPTAWYTLARL